jgi:hypothetical protein
MQQRCCDHSKGLNMKTSLVTAEQISAFFANGGVITKVDDGVRTMKPKEIELAVRGESAPVISDVKPYERRVLKIRV